MYAVIRIRGLKGVRPEIRSTMEKLQLDRKNHCVLVPEKADIRGMLEKARDYVAYGNVKEETLIKLVEKRGRGKGDVLITPAFLKEHQMDSAKGVVDALVKGTKTLLQMGIKPVFRLNAPRKGFGKKGIKQSAGLKGPLGFHAEGMDKMLVQMM